MRGDDTVGTLSNGGLEGKYAGRVVGRRTVRGLRLAERIPRPVRLQRSTHGQQVKCIHHTHTIQQTTKNGVREAFAKGSKLLSKVVRFKE